MKIHNVMQISNHIPRLYHTYTTHIPCTYHIYATKTDKIYIREKLENEGKKLTF